MSGLHEFRNEIRWTIVVLVLAVLAVVALWPRDSGPLGPAQEAQPGQAGASAPPPVAEKPVDPRLRAQAALEACRPAEDGRRAQLTGAVGTCLADGVPADLAALVGGRPTLVNTWATWCAPCREELPALQAYSERPGAIDVVGVQVQSGAAEGLELLRALGVHYPNLHDGENRIRQALPMPNVLPVSFVVTAEGEVRRVDPPIAFGSADEVDSAVRRTLGGGR